MLAVTCRITSTTRALRVVYSAPGRSRPARAAPAALPKRCAHRRHRLVSLDDLLDLGWDPADPYDLEAETIRKDLVLKLVACIERVPNQPHRWREWLERRLGEGLTLRQVATSLGVSRRVAERLEREALRRLRRIAEARGF